VNIPPGKFYTPEAKKLIVKLKDYGMSYWWIEMRMGVSSNWGRRIVNDKALVNDAQLAYLRELVRVFAMLPKKMRRTRLHAGTSSPRYIDPLRPKNAPKNRKESNHVKNRITSN
jgi:hypothetical protein